MRLQELRQTVEQQGYDAEELLGLLELSVDDLLERFPDKLVDNAHKFGVSEDTND